MNSQFRKKTAIIIGAGPAGLTAAYELLKRTDIVPVILEKSGDIGGISKTINYKGNRMDIGGHRFFSKSDRVMTWWFNIMPVQTNIEGGVTVSYQNKSREVEASSTPIADPDKVMLIRNRLSRIYFLRKFFTYPIQLSIDTLGKLGPFRTIAIMFSYLAAQLFPRKPENNLEDFMINRFGKVLYKLFFKDYTEKVWGIPCHKISAEWGAQRIKGVSISKALQHAIQSATKKKKGPSDIAQKDTETSLIEQFLYPKFGPGQLWEEVARQVEEMGGKILMQHDVKRIYTSDNENRISAIAAINRITGETSYLEGDYFFSTMPVQELIGGIDGSIPEDVKNVASGLQYRDFITVGILLKKLSYKDKSTGEWKPLELKDTWIYIQEKDVTVGRLQVFNNWSPYMVKNPQNTWIGMEFFCNQHEAFWNKPDQEIKQIAILELEKIGLASPANVLDSTIIRVEKTYPAYFGTYDRFDVIRQFTDKFENLFLVGRNGMHKYNNSDHSMLTAMTAVDNIVAGITSKENIWRVNTEQEYHEEKKGGHDNKDERLEHDIPPVHERKPVHPLKSMLQDEHNTQNFVILAILVTCVQFVIFKYFYPFADFSNDSYTYLSAGFINDNASFRPIGYSKFLRAFSSLSTSDYIFTAFQYLLLQVSLLYSFLSLKYFYRLSRLATLALFFVLILNPMTLYMANYISPDGVFSALTIVWFIHLIWLLVRPGKFDLYISTLLLITCLSLRYNALFYPGIAVLCFIIARYTWVQKITGIAFLGLTLTSFIALVKAENADYLGTRVFSTFGGWQLANNALYMYREVKRKDLHFANPQLEILDSLSRHYLDTAYKSGPKPPVLNADYMWNDKGPLKRYWFNYIKLHAKDSARAWHEVSPVFSAYGSELVRSNPLAFARYFVWPNFKDYLKPSLEVFEQYNIGDDTVKTVAREWFHYSTARVYSRVGRYQKILLKPAPYLFTLANIFLFLSIPVWYVRHNRNVFTKVQNELLLLLTLFIIANLCFSIAAAPIVFRYQYCAMLLAFATGLVIIGKTKNDQFADANTNL